MHEQFYEVSGRCEERKSDCFLYFIYSVLLSKNIEIQRRDICFSSFCISEL